jgi:FkbM family methyltransferase
MNILNKTKKTFKKSKWLVHGVRKIKNGFKKHAPPDEPRDLYKDMRNLCTSINLKNPTFIDGGAHNGSTILKLRDEGFMNCKIYAFEPLPEVAKAIETIGDSDVTVFAKALGNTDGTIDFNVNKKLVTSSPLPPKMSDKYHPGLADLSKKITVPVVKIDTLLREKKITQPDIIKFDLQGYELFGFQGAVETLKQVKIIFTEIEFVELYKNQPLFHDISLFLHQNNFSLFGLYNMGNHDDGQIIAGDALFVNNKYFNT